MHHASVVRDLDQQANGSTCNSIHFMYGVKEIRDIWIYGFILFLALILFGCGQLDMSRLAMIGSKLLEFTQIHIAV